MLGIDFLNPPRPITVAGMEFMDYQDPKFYQDLVGILNHAIVDEVVIDKDGEEKEHLRILGDRNILKDLESLVMDRTGIKLSIVPPSEGTSNAAVNSGYLNPGNLMNNFNIEQIVDVGESSIARAFRRLQTDVLKGFVDTKNARIGGDFSKVDFTLFLGKYVDTWLDLKFLARYKVSVAEGVAAVITHELGHIFTGFLFVTRSVIDSIMPSIAIRNIVNGRKYGKERVGIVYETLKELECTTRPDHDLIEGATGEELMVMFDKAIGTRDVRRTLSLGSTTRGSEIYADLFAVRAGCPKALVAAMTHISNDPIAKQASFLFLGCSILAALVSAPILAGLGAVFSLGLGLSHFDHHLNPNMVYDSPYRRIKNMLRDQIVTLNTTKMIDNRSRAQFLKQTKEMEKIIDDAKPFLEGTGFQRFVGWVMSGSEFKAAEFEHYTDELVGHTLAVYKDTF